MLKYFVCLIAAVFLLGCCVNAAAAEPESKIGKKLAAAMESDPDRVYKIWLTSNSIPQAELNQLIFDQTGYDPAIYENSDMFNAIVRPPIEDAVWARVCEQGEGLSQEELIARYRNSLSIAIADAHNAYRSVRMTAAKEAYRARLEEFIAACVPGDRHVYMIEITGTLILFADRDEIMTYIGLDFVKRLELCEDSWSNWGEEAPVELPDLDPPEVEDLPYAEAVFEFRDVSGDAYYHDAVQWAVSAEPCISIGTSLNTFGPKKDCTRAQLLTFLWRACGCPEASAELPFLDVKEDAYYHPAVLWALENSVTAGTGAATFAPGAVCTRAQALTFLWRALGCPEPESAVNPFEDVRPGAYYEKAVLWAYENGVTSGTSDTSFSPEETCTRGQVMTFLYNVFGS